MRSSIYSMNHSPRTQELPTGKLPFERDVLALHAALVFAVGETSARIFGMSMTGKKYGEMCELYADAIARECDADNRTVASAANTDDLGTRFIITGGEVVELDAPADEQSDEIPF